MVMYAHDTALFLTKDSTVRATVERRLDRLPGSVQRLAVPVDGSHIEKFDLRHDEFFLTASGGSTGYRKEAVTFTLRRSSGSDAARRVLCNVTRKDMKTPEQDDEFDAAVQWLQLGHERAL